MSKSTRGGKSVPLPGSRRYHRAGAQVLGRASGDEWCDITVKVRRKAPLPEPAPGKIISKDEITSKYGADPKDISTVKRVLTAAGLTVKATNTAARALYVGGAVKTMEQTFGLQLFRVKHNDVLYRGRLGEIHIPAELAGVVTGVFGLDTRPMIKRRKRMNLQASVGVVPPPAQRSWYIPQELAAAYQFPAGDGTGQTIGVLEFGGQFIRSDLQAFWDATKNPSPIPNVRITHVEALTSADQNDPDSIGETMLDIEIVASLCPAANLVMYFSNWSEKGWVDNLDAALADKPTVLSISYGLAEGTDIWTQQAMDDLNDTLKELANGGVTACVSSGDDGSDDQVGDGQPHIDFPATSPYVLSVGGTALSRSAGTEVLWFDGDGLRKDNGGSGGGGVSAFNARPSWQTVDVASVVPNAMNGRVVPDVAANAAGSTGYFIISQNQSGVSGGTSAATPLWASLIARLQQSGIKVGFLSPLLYQTSPASEGKPVGAVAFNDITSGDNATGAAAGYSALSGFDAVTGWGSPIGTTLLRNLNPAEAGRPQ